MKAISLFSGIGGMDIGASVVGFDIISQVEIDKFCQAILKKHCRHWLNAVIYDDVRNFGKKDINEPIDLIFGGFPCQPFSHAGERLADGDIRNMWHETLRVIREVQPKAILLENVAGLITPITQKDGTIDPAYLGLVLGQLSESGYSCFWQVLSAEQIGFPHKRERVFIIGYHEELGNASGAGLENITVSNSARQNEISNKQITFDRSGDCVSGGGRRKRRTKPRMGRNVNGLSSWLDRPIIPSHRGDTQRWYEPPRTLPRSMVQKRGDRLKALGNAVVPQVVYPLFCAIKQVLENTNN